MVLICWHLTKGKSDDVITHALTLLYLCLSVCVCVCVCVCARARARARVCACTLIFSEECCGSICSIVEVNDRYNMDFIGFIQEQMSPVVKVNNFWVEGKMKISFCV